MKGYDSVRADLRKTWQQLDALEPGSIVVDAHGAAWQYGRYGYWYRAYDADQISSFEMMQMTGPIRVLFGAPSSDEVRSSGWVN